MTREDVKRLFPDATDEQITQLLNQNNSEVAREKGKADKYKADADKAAELQAKLDELDQQNLTELEKANKATEAATNRVADLEAEIKKMQQKNSLAELGIIGEQADKLVGANGIDYAILGQIISDREAKAAIAKEKEIAGNAGNPNGGSGGSGDKQSMAEKLATELYGNKQSQEGGVLSHYIN